MNKERLLKLADHLDALDISEWDFDEYMSADGIKGCAIGQCPKIWPEAWYTRHSETFDRTVLEYKPDPKCMTHSASEEFFALTGEQADAVFQNLPDPTPKDCADAIRNLVAGVI